MLAQWSYKCAGAPQVNDYPDILHYILAWKRVFVEAQSRLFVQKAVVF